MMRRLLIAVFASLLAVALIAPAAQGATRVRQVQVEMRIPVPGPPGSPITYQPAGTLTLDFVFKNKRSNKRKFTPRQLIRIDFSKVRLDCSNSPAIGPTQLLLNTTLETKIKLTKVPPPNPTKAKPGRYAFRFAYSFPTFTGTISGTIDKPNSGAKPRSPRSQGTLIIEDLDADPGHSNCWTGGRRSWGGLPLTAA